MLVRVVVLCVWVGVSLAANPNYSYHIKIDDAAHANFQEKAETRKGPDAVGFYSLVEPNGARRTVEYTADDRGFNPTVTYSHEGVSVYQQYAPAFVQDRRVQIVDKFTGPPPALNFQPFALPAPTYGFTAVAPAPLVVPAPLRAAPAPQLIAQAQGVNYAPAYMPPVTAFLQQQVKTYLPPAPVVQQVRTYLPPPQPQPIQQVTYLPPPPPPQIVQKQVRTYLPPPQPIQQVTYLPPPPPPQIVQKQVRTYLPPPQPIQQVRTYLPPQPPAVIAVQKPSAVFSTPKLSIEKAPVQVIQDSYAVAPVNTVTDLNGPVYPEAIKVAEKPVSTYGPPNFTPGKPLSTFEVQPVAVKKPVKVTVTVVGPPPPPPPPPVKLVQAAPPQKLVQYQYAPPQKLVQYQYAPPQKLVQYQYAPQVQYVQPVQKVVQQQQVYAPAPVLPKVVTPAVAPLGLYASAIGYHTQNSHATGYQHSYGTQGFQVTSSRQYNKAVLPVAQPQYIQPAPVAAPVLQYHQQVYAPQYLPPPQAPVVHQVQHQVAGPVAPAPVYGPPPPAQYAFAAPVAKLVQPAAAVAVGKKQNPLTFAYSYDHGGAKVSHSYSGSGW